jgi:hypothetical protein
MASKTELILATLKSRLETIPAAHVERNSAVPEKIPTGGLIVLRDGDPGEPETTLGGFGGVYYSHGIEIELYIEDGDATARDAAFDALVQAIDTALETDPTLGGLAFGMIYGRPEINTEAAAGAPAIKSGTIIITVEYETTSLLG